VAVDSIWTSIKRRDIGCQHLLGSTREMPLREVNRIRKFNDLPEEIRSRSEALDDAGNLLPSRTRPPKVVSGRDVTRSFVILGDANLRRGFGIVAHRIHIETVILRPAVGRRTSRDASIVIALNWLFPQECREKPRRSN